MENNKKLKLAGIMVDSGEFTPDEIREVMSWVPEVRQEGPIEIFDHTKEHVDEALNISVDGIKEKLKELYSSNTRAGSRTAQAEMDLARIDNKYKIWIEVNSDEQLVRKFARIGLGYLKNKNELQNFFKTLPVPTMEDITDEIDGPELMLLQKLAEDTTDKKMILTSDGGSIVEMENPMLQVIMKPMIELAGQRILELEYEHPFAVTIKNKRAYIQRGIGSVGVLINTVKEKEWK